MTTQRTSWFFAAPLFAAAVWIGCRNDGADACDPDDPDACADGERCIADADGRDGVCEAVDACDPQDAESCPGGYVCRPSAAGPVCEPEPSAGRIPSCIDSDGMDVFAIEANGALGVSWNVNADIDASGGFRVAWGTDMGEHDELVTVGAEEREAIVSPLDNATTYYVVVEALSAGGDVTFTSCEVFAVPHVLVFQPEVRVNADAGGLQQTAALGSNLEGTHLYLVWDDDGTIVMARSDDFGDTWTSELAIGSGTAPAIAVRDAVVEDDAVVSPETVFIAFAQGGRVQLARYLPDDDALVDPLDVAAGDQPAVAVGPAAIHLAFEDGGAIHHSGSIDDGESFLEPIAVHGSTSTAEAPDIAVNGFTGDVYVAWHAIEGAGDSNIYFASSFDEGAEFGGPVRVDDDSMGQNQLNVSIAIDARSQKIYATWEDRRGGANVYFTWSEDWGETWQPNIDVGAGLGGDQFRPQAVVDAARNVYVTFQDTTNGARVVFTRFNADGSFDPPLQPSSRAGMAGVVGDEPTVATDRYGGVYVAWQENRDGADTDVFFARAQ
jgi:hypothetical protein